jgi:hypothetical protein
VTHSSQAHIILIFAFTTTETMASDTLSLPQGNVVDKEEHISHPRLTNKQLADFARSRNLPPPMFIWNPRFNELPNETLDLIVSFLDFHVTVKHRNSPYTITEGVEAVISAKTSHPLNKLARVSKRLNSIVEKHCELLLKKHKVSTPANAPLAGRVTNRQTWLHYIGDKCIFCFKTSREVAARITKTRQESNNLSSFEEYTKIRDTLDSTRMRDLTGTPFNHNILCCAFCEYEHVGPFISLERAVEKYKVPKYFFMFSPAPIRMGRRDKPYGYIPRSWMTERINLNDDDECGSAIAKLSLSESPAIYLIEDEVVKVRDAIVADPDRLVPAWMRDMPGCIGEAKNRGQRT